MPAFYGAPRANQFFNINNSALGNPWGIIDILYRSAWGDISKTPVNSMVEVVLVLLISQEV